MRSRQVHRRRSKKKQGIIQRFNHEIFGLLIISFSILVALGLYYNGSTGIFGDFTKILLRGMLGLPAYVIPVIILAIGIFRMFNRVDDEFRLRILYSVILLLLSSGIIHGTSISDLKEVEVYSFNDFLEIVVKSFQNASAFVETGISREFGMPRGGGVLGALLSIPFLWVFKSTGTLVILYTLFIIFIILLTNVSIVNFLHNLKELLKKVILPFSSIRMKRPFPLKGIFSSPDGVPSPMTRKMVETSLQTPRGDAEYESKFHDEASLVAPDIQKAVHDLEDRTDESDIKKSRRKNLMEENGRIENVMLETEQEDKAVESIVRDLKEQTVSERRKKRERAETEEGKTAAKPIDIEIGKTITDWVDGRNYVFPPISLLRENPDISKGKTGRVNIEDSAKKLVDTLSSFGVSVKVTNVSRGPTVTRYELQPGVGVKVNKIVNLSDDIALNLAASGVRIEAPIPGKAAVGIEVPNKEINMVYLREVIESQAYQNFPSKITFAIGKNIAGDVVVADIGKMPHLLIAGSTGSGKSVCINSLITSILYKASPKEVKLLMVDPKVVELGGYNGIPHLLIPVVTDPRKAAGALNWAVQEMVNRYKLFAERGVRDIKGYNNSLKELGEEGMLPQIVIIIDELADLMMVAPNDVEDAICRLAQMARAAGMHLVIATQRPSVDVITGVIKANIPSRIAFAVSSQVDSRTILDMAGAEKLLGKGDMLFHPIGEPKPIRVQCAFVHEKEIEAVIDHIKSQFIAEYNEDILEKINSSEAPEKEEKPGDNDELLPQAIELVVENGQASVSLVQRKFKVGYARAARIIDQMEERGIVGKYEGSKPRQVLMTRQQWLEMNMGESEK